MSNGPNKTTATDPCEIATHAGVIMKLAQEHTALSLIELAIVFKAAAQICDECGMAYERAQMQQKLRNWRPGHS